MTVKESDPEILSLGRECHLTGPGQTPGTPAGNVVKVMDGERIAFIEERQPETVPWPVVRGDVDDNMLEAPEDS